MKKHLPKAKKVVKCWGCDLPCAERLLDDDGNCPDCKPWKMEKRGQWEVQVFKDGRIVKRRKTSLKFPNESEYAQYVRGLYDLPDNVNVEKAVLHAEKKTESDKPKADGTLLLGQLNPGDWWTTGSLRGQVVSQHGGCTVVQLSGDFSNCSNHAQTTIAPGTVVKRTVDWEEDLKECLSESNTKNGTSSAKEGQKSPNAPSVKPVSQKGQDKYGYRNGTGAALINSVLSSKWKTAAQIETESKCGRTASSHLSSLLKAEVIVRRERDGVKQYKLKEGK